MRKIILGLTVILTLGGALCAEPVMTYQGRLKEAGLPVNQPRDFAFQICSDPNSGICYPTPATAQSFPVQNGLFKSTFTVPSTPGGFMNGDWYLQVTVNSSPLTPREKLTFVPYAVYAATAGYVDGVVQKTGDVMNGNLSIFTPAMGPLVSLHGGSSVYARISVDTDRSLFGVDDPLKRVALGAGGGETLSVTASSVGVNNSAPSHTLDVTGDARISADAIVGGTLTVQSNTYTVGFSSAAKFYGDGSALTNISATGFSGVLTIPSGGTGGNTAASARGNLGVPGGTGNSGRLARWTDAVTLGDSGLADNGSVFTVNEPVGISSDAAIAGNVAIGTTAAAYRLVVSSGAGEAGTIMTVSTGTTDIFWVTGNGAHALKYSGAAGSESAPAYSVGAANTGMFAVGAVLSFAVGGIERLGISGNGLSVDTNGTASVPSISWGGASGATGLFSAGTNAIGFTTGASEAMRISDGTVGIGTQNPDQRLTVNGNISQTGVLISSGLGNNYFAGSVGIATGVPQGLFDIAGATFVVKSDGKVGIGTSNPERKFQISGDASQNIPFGMTNGNYAAGVSGSSLLVGFGGALGDVYSSLQANTTGGTAYGDIILGPYGGNVGIGVTAPGAKLEVSDPVEQLRLSYDATGDNQASFVVDSQGFLNIGTANGNIVLNPGADEITIPAGKHISQVDGTSYLGNLVVNTATDHDFRVASRGATADLLLGTGGTGFVRVESTVTVAGYGVFASTVQIAEGSLKYGAGAAGTVLKSAGNGYAYWGVDNTGAVGLTGTKYFLRMEDAAGTSLTDSLLLQPTGTNITMVAGSSLTITGSGFSVGGSTFVVAAGNIGIGTSGPIYKLDIGGDSRIFSADNAPALLFAQNLGDVPGTSGYTSAIVGNTESTARALSFYTQYQGTYSEKMRLTGTGNVGIGTTSPNAKLDVVAGGNNGNDYAQIWRNLAGTAVATMTATGVLYASLPGDGLGSHVATTTLNMAGYSVVNVSTIAVSGLDGGVVIVPYVNNALVYANEGGVAIGSDTYSNYTNGIGIGNSANNNHNNGTGVGNGANNNYNQGTGLGFGASQNYSYGLGVGYNSWGNYSNGAGIGFNAVNNHDSGVGLGDSASENHHNGVGIGTNAGHNANYAIGIGAYSQYNGTYGSALGAYSYAASSSVALGSYAKANAGGSIAIGAGTVNDSTGTASFGAYAINTSSTVTALKYYGDASGLYNIPGDGLGNHVATTTLQMGSNAIESASFISADRYKINDNTVLTVLPGNGSLGVGVNAGASNNSSGVYNVFIGSAAGMANTSGQQNTFVGAFAGSANTTNKNNTFVGSSAGNVNDGGEFNTFLGATAGSQNSTGKRNTLVGSGAGNNITTGDDNSVLGNNAALFNHSGSANTIIGAEAGVGSASFANSTLIGFRAGYQMTGGNNILVGYNAGTSIVGGANNIVIGNSIGVLSPADNYVLNIGSAIYGNLFTGMIGIGTPAPAAMLDVVSTGTYAQIWRNSNGIAVATMTASGQLYATLVSSSLAAYSLTISTGFKPILYVSSDGVKISNGDVNSSTQSVLSVQGLAYNKTGGTDIGQGVEGLMRTSGTGPEDVVAGGSFESEVDSNDQAAVAVGEHIAVRVDGAAHADTVMGILVDDLTNAGTVNNTYGIHIGGMTSGTQTHTPYAIYSQDPNAATYFAGGVGIGTDSIKGMLRIVSPITNGDYAAAIEQVGATIPSGIIMAKAGGTTAAKTSVGLGDRLAGLRMLGYFNTDYADAAAIESVVDGTPAAGGVPARLEFKTAATGGVGVQTRLVIKNNGAVGISTGAPQAALDVVTVSSATDASAQIWRDYYGSAVATMTAQGALFDKGFFADARTNGPTSIFFSGNMEATINGSDSVSDFAAVARLKIRRENSGGGIVNRAFGLFIDDINLAPGAGIITDTYGIYIGTQTAAGQQTNTPYALYSADSQARTYFAGRVGIGMLAPSAALHVKAGTSSPGTAPLKFMSGPTLTVSEAGAVEFDGNHLFFTVNNAGARYQLDQQAGAVTISAIGAASNANGMTLAGQQLNLEPADATHGGVVTTGAQTFAGSKTFSSIIGGSVNGNANTASSLTGGTPGAIPYQSGAGTTSMLTAGAIGYVLTGAGASMPGWTQATNTNVASTIVQRDASGNFAAGTITVAALTAGGALSVTSGGSTALTLDSGSTGAVYIANGANGKAITIGNNSAGTALMLNSGSGGFAINSSQLYINQANGKVGLGTSSPDQNLTVVGGASFGGVLISSGTGNDYFAGNVGLGTSSPVSKLEVAGGSITISGANANLVVGGNASRYVYDDAANYRTAFSSNVYVVGYSSAAKFYGDGSALSNISGDGLGNHVATTTLNMAGNVITGVSAIEMNNNYLAIVPTGTGGSNSDHGISIGAGTYDNYTSGLGIGNGAYSNYSQGVGLGNSAYNNYTGAVGVGANAQYNYSFGVGVGASASYNHDSGVGVGVNAQYNYNYGVGVGGYALHNSDYAVGIGAFSQYNKGYGSALGAYSYAASSATALGAYARASNIWAVALGYNASATAQNSVCIGANCVNNATATVKIADGYGLTMTGPANAGYYQVNGSTVLSVLPGIGSVALGVHAGEGGGGSYDTFVGYQAGQANAGGGNSFVGYQAGQVNSSGAGNSFFGDGAGQLNTTGANNLFLGAWSGFNTVTGQNNTVVGTSAGVGTVGQSFSNSTLLGYQAGYSLQTGNGNVFVGYNAGYSVTTGTGNIIIGASADAPTGATNNFLNIGNAITANLATGNVTIGKYAMQPADTGVTLTAADYGKTITVNSGSLQTINLPSVGAADIGAQFTVIKLGVGQVNIHAYSATYIADSSAGGNIYNAAVTPPYASITLRLVSDGSFYRWVLLGGEGSWVTN